MHLYDEIVVCYLSTIVVNFIYRAPVHNKTYLMALISKSMSTLLCLLFNSLIYRDPTCPPRSNNMVRVARKKWLFVVVSIVKLSLKRVKDLQLDNTKWVDLQ